MSNILVEEVHLKSYDGHTLVAHFFQPEVIVHGAIMMVPAMGVFQKFYEPIAKWLAQQGYLVLTFDFSGMGASRQHGPLRKLNFNLQQWTQHDCDTALAALRVRAGEQPIYWLGHSFGGQIFGFLSHPEHIDRFVTVASGTGYWRENSAQLQRKVWVLWYILVPLLNRLFGYFPGARLGAVGDLPRRVMRQWRRWCLHPDYAVGVEGEAVRLKFARIRAPIDALSMKDDEFMSRHSIPSLLRLYPNAPSQIHLIAPQDIGVRRIGHFDFFRPQFEPTLWQNHLLPQLRPHAPP